MRHANVFVLCEEHIEVFQRNLRSGTVEYRAARRSRILLLRHQGLGPEAVAERVGCDPATVWRVEQRYRRRGSDALKDLPRPGRPPAFSPSAARTNRSTGLS